VPTEIRSRPMPPRETAKPIDWERTRLGVMIPLCVIVGVAIACIVVAGLTSAQRADEVALDRERHLFAKALIARGQWSVRSLRAALPDIPDSESLDGSALRDTIGERDRSIADHDIVVIVDPMNDLYAMETRSRRHDAMWTRSDMAELRPLIEHLQRNLTDVPVGVAALRDDADIAAPLKAPTAVIQRVRGRPAIVAAASLWPGEAPEGKAAPLMLTVTFMDGPLLSDIAARLHLTNLRAADSGAVPGGDHRHELRDAYGHSVARFLWTPRRPGAEVFGSVVPFIGIAVAGFVFLAGLMLRYMRQTANAITTGENRLRHLAMHDPLSGLPNRHSFGERLEGTIRSVRQGGGTAAVFYIDLDHFKDVNDTLGHPVGDALICSVTQRLTRTLRGDAMVARLGGDEFALIASAPPDHDELQAIAGRLIATLCAPYSIDGRTIVIGASIGISVIDDRSEADAADILRYADMALYRAKGEGRNRACIYDAVMDADLSKRKLVEQDLREAICNGDIGVAFQPIVNASGERVIGVEALARWHHPERGAISPAEFIAIAEHCGLIADLGAHVLRRACAEGKAWPGITIAVNVSPLQFRQSEFVFTVERILAETGLEPARLELELTESMLIGNLESAEAAMRKLKALGVRLALDDFGTGYSSLQYLRRLPFDRLKIDRSFVLGLEKTADSAAIVHAIVSLGRGLGMKVTAEGVETAEQHLFLRAAGVHCMQGYRFGRPGSTDEIARRVANPGVYRSIETDAAAALAS
jgi:diguanylate cyclase